VCVSDEPPSPRSASRAHGRGTAVRERIFPLVFRSQLGRSSELLDWECAAPISTLLGELRQYSGTHMSDCRTR